MQSLIINKVIEELYKFIDMQPIRMPAAPKTFVILEAHTNRVLYKEVQNGKISEDFFNHVVQILKKYKIYEYCASTPRHYEELNYKIACINNEIGDNYAKFNSN